MVRASLARPALLLASTRLVSLAVGLVLVPVMLHALGGEGFAAWAILLSGAALLAELELGMPLVLVRHLALPLHASDTTQARQVFCAVAIIVAAIYAAAAPLVLLLASPVARWLRLPETGLMTPAQMLTVVLAATALRAVLQLGTAVLLSARAFSLVATFSLLQPLLSNSAAGVAALLARRLDLTLLWYWGIQVGVCSVAFGFALARLGPWRSGIGAWDWARCGRLLSYGATVQVSSWAHTLTFHVNKLLVVRTLGLAAVPGYEVASRGVLALRSTPAAGLDTFLPTATIEATGGPTADLRSMLTLGLYGALVFIGAPMAVAPVLLYGWIGELGFVSRWIFVGLGVAAGVNLIVMPIATMAQALGRPALQARAALLTVSVTVILGLAVVQTWKLEGLAFATAVAAAAGAALLTTEVHRSLGIRAKEALGSVLAGRWPPIAVCLVYGLGVHWAFSRWLEATPLAARYTVSARATGLVVCGCLYLTCLGAMVVGQGVFRGFDRTELALFARVRAQLSWPARPSPKA